MAPLPGRSAEDLLTRAPDTFKGAATRNVSTSKGEFVLRSSVTARNLEVSLYQGSVMVGKFFLSRTLEGGQHPLEKFRIPKEDVMLSFVAKP